MVNSVHIIGKNWQASTKVSYVLQFAEFPLNPYKAHLQGLEKIAG